MAAVNAIEVADTDSAVTTVGGRCFLPVKEIASHSKQLSVASCQW
jgi:hypothetical protein